jgi:hypothetical protein
VTILPLLEINSKLNPLFSALAFDDPSFAAKSILLLIAISFSAVIFKTLFVFIFLFVEIKGSEMVILPIPLQFEQDVDIITSPEASLVKISDAKILLELIFVFNTKVLTLLAVAGDHAPPVVELLLIVMLAFPVVWAIINLLDNKIINMKKKNFFKFIVL